MEIRSHHALSLPLLLIGACIAAAEDGAGTFNGPAVKVNAQIVSIREVERVFADSYLLIQDKLRRGQLRRAQLAEAIGVAWQEALEIATQDRIIDQLADKTRKDIIRSVLSRAGGELNEKQALDYYRRWEDDCLRQVRRELVAAAGGEQELRNALRRRGQTMQDWEAGLVRELYRREVLQRELGSLASSPAAARAFYDVHPELFRQEEVWRLRRIRVSKNKFSSAEVARQAADLVVKKIKAGADFAEIAARVSEDPEFAKDGGRLKFSGSSDLPTGAFPREQQVAQDLADGQVSDPVGDGEAWLIVQRVSHQALKIQPFEDVVERAEALAFAEKLKQRKRELFEKLKDRSYVEVLQKTPPANLLTGAADFPPAEFVDPSNAAQ